MAKILKVPQKNESPIPERGPIKAALTLFIDSGSKLSGFLAFSSSIAVVIPITNVESGGEQLKKAMCL